MVLFRMLRVALRLGGLNLLTPWRSPLLRWRLETYGVRDAGGRLLHADQITPLDFLRFLLTHRGALARFLRWAATL
ncbi:MAG: hypothetical protein COV75_07265 [Candidatus Omnitrophica bacterium CG11_big_fil_rev_8_21_14_0_20_63_9]|nr:MAG: hypothetical protein COV75_07265 [Candidatus Omnitrophica bacterium CG11_big_fil_rev_8_21_14_0_20_63_9]